MLTVKYVLCIAILAVSLKNVRALSDDEKAGIHEELLPHIVDCAKELGVEEESLKEAKEKKSLDGIDNCFFACILKKSGIMDDKGKFDPEKALEHTKEHISADEDIKKAAEVFEECSAVNSEDVSDGDAGCDRAKLLVDCFIKNKEKVFGD